VVRLWPIQVLVLSPDRYFRAAAAMLIGRRGCTALSAATELEAVELAGAERVDVIVLERPAEQGRRGWEVPVRTIASAIDVAMARQGARVAPVGIVVVSERTARDGDRDGDRDRDGDGGGGGGAQSASPVSLELDKWGPFEELFRAIARADRARRLPRERRYLPWPASLRQASAGD
jgi:hypothetical protein